VGIVARIHRDDSAKNHPLPLALPSKVHASTSKSLFNLFYLCQSFFAREFI